MLTPPPETYSIPPVSRRPSWGFQTPVALPAGSSASGVTTVLVVIFGGVVEFPQLFCGLAQETFASDNIRNTVASSLTASETKWLDICCPPFGREMTGPR